MKFKTLDERRIAVYQRQSKWIREERRRIRESEMINVDNISGTLGDLLDGIDSISVHNDQLLGKTTRLNLRYD